MPDLENQLWAIRVYKGAPPNNTEVLVIGNAKDPDALRQKLKDKGYYLEPTSAIGPAWEFANEIELVKPKKKER